jgi:hypothetical protein
MLFHILQSDRLTLFVYAEHLYREIGLRRYTLENGSSDIYRVDKS